MTMNGSSRRAHQTAVGIVGEFYECKSWRERLGAEIMEFKF